MQIFFHNYAHHYEHHPPSKIQILQEGATYELPTYHVTENGLEDYGSVILQFVKGNKEDKTVYRQVGTTTENLLVALVEQLKNVTQVVPSAYGTETLMHLEKALEATQRRAKDRAERGVLGSYQK